eukprot:7272971-Prymnesium_polylepis.1
MEVPSAHAHALVAVTPLTHSSSARAPVDWSGEGEGWDGVLGGVACWAACSRVTAAGRETVGAQRWAVGAWAARH